MNLDRYGSACRCLLRLRENQGNLVISDEMFIATYGGRYATWSERPGEVDLAIIAELARDLQVGSRVEAAQGYAHLLSSHRAGCAILLRSIGGQQGEDRYALVEDIDGTSLTVWEPTADGYARSRSFEYSDDHWGNGSDAVVLHAPTYQTVPN